MGEEAVLLLAQDESTTVNLLKQSVVICNSRPVHMKPVLSKYKILMAETTLCVSLSGTAIKLVTAN